MLTFNTVAVLSECLCYCVLELSLPGNICFQTLTKNELFYLPFCMAMQCIMTPNTPESLMYISIHIPKVNERIVLGTVVI